MKKDNNSGYKTFKKVMIGVGVVVGLVILHLAFNYLIPFIKEMHGF